MPGEHGFKMFCVRFDKNQLLGRILACLDKAAVKLCSMARLVPKGARRLLPSTCKNLTSDSGSNLLPQIDGGLPMARVGQGTYVTIIFEAFLQSGVKVMATNPGKTLVFRFGSGEVWPAIEQEITGLSPGEKKTFEVAPEDAYGTFDPSKVIRIPISEAPSASHLKRGTVLEMENDKGEKRLCFVGDIEQEYVVLDFNHPLAGKTLKYRVEVLDVQSVT